MMGCLQLGRMLRVVAVAAAFWLAPQAASAHGHSHHAAAAEAISLSQPAATQGTARQVQSLTAAIPAAYCADKTDSDLGCCSNGPCTGCHRFAAAPVPATLPPTPSSVLRLDDPPPHLDARQTRLRRPPKSFV
jgi:hypothetical protein